MVIIIQTQPFLICNELHIDLHPCLINCSYMRLHKREDSVEMCTTDIISCFSLHLLVRVCLCTFGYQRNDTVTRKSGRMLSPITDFYWSSAKSSVKCIFVA